MEKPTLSICMDPYVLKRIDEAAKKLRLSRSRLIENLCIVALTDYDILSRSGFIDLIIKVRDFRVAIGSNVPEVM